MVNGDTTGDVRSKYQKRRRLGINGNFSIPPNFVSPASQKGLPSVEAGAKFVVTSMTDETWIPAFAGMTGFLEVLK